MRIDAARTAVLVIIVIFLVLGTCGPRRFRRFVPAGCGHRHVCRMWLLGFSLDNLSLLALTLATGFVVDDAIVVLENIVRKVEGGLEPLEGAIQGANEIFFTVISISTSLVAVVYSVALHGRHRRPSLPRIRRDADDRDYRSRRSFR